MRDAREGQPRSPQPDSPVTTVWRNLKISHKLHLGFGVLVAFTFLVVGRSYVSERTATQQIQIVDEVQAPAALTSANAQAELLRMMSDLRAYLATGESRYRDRYQAARREFETELLALTALAQHLDADDDTQQYLDQLQATYEAWRSLPDQLFRLRDSALENQPALRLFEEQVEFRIADIQNQTEQLLEVQERRSPSASNVVLLKDIATFQSSLALMVAALQSYLTTQDQDFRFEYATHLQANQAAWEALQRRQAGLTADQQTALATIGERRSQFLVLPEQIFEIVNSDRYREDLYLFETQAEPLADTMMSLLADIVNTQQQSLTAYLGTSVRSLEAAQLQILITGLLALLVSGLMAMILQRQIAHPIRRLTAVTTRIIDGDLDAQAVVESQDEIGVLATTFNQMTQKLTDSSRDLATSNAKLQSSLQAQEQYAAELERAKAAAETANQAKSEFLANINHELRTPLNGILGYAQILQREADLTPDQQKGVTIIQQCGSHLLTLINDVLDLAKIEARKLELLPQDFHLKTFLVATAEICRIKAQQKGIGFTSELGADLPPAVQADEKRLRQVLLNLLSNAVKFTETGGVIFRVQSRHDVAPEADMVTLRFWVQDSGVGIPRDRLGTIFQPFEQVGKQAHKAEGTGLGLAISRQILQMMGSKIHVDSAPGEGSTFWFDLTLPLAADRWHEVKTGPTGPQVTGFAGKPRQILVVDDHAENRSVIVSMLAPLGFQVAEADDGYQGIAQARLLNPDLIITDLVMPELDGIEMAQRLRQVPEFAETPILASSASLSLIDPQESLQAGCDGFLPKPIEWESLLAALETHLDLTWCYADVPASAIAPAPPPTDFLIPPAAALRPLYEAAQKGLISQMQTEAERLQHLHQDYIPFGQRVLELSREFEVDAILHLIEPHL